MALEKPGKGGLGKWGFVELEMQEIGEPGTLGKWGFVELEKQGNGDL